ncbi:hypothetical protein D3C73_1638550 [compost metagenome]
MLAARARAAGNRQREYAEDEGHRGHDDRPDTQLGRFDRRFRHRHAFVLMQFFGELDNQYGVLRRQPDGG